MSKYLKMVGIFAVVALLAMVITTAVLAQGPRGGASPQGSDAEWSGGRMGGYAARGAFVDADGDGVCDNAGTCSNFVDEDGDGVCDNAGAGCGNCAGNCSGEFVDEDGDGVCDNASGERKAGSGFRRGGGRGGLRGGCGAGNGGCPMLTGETSAS